jgi:hypothetical protein
LTAKLAEQKLQIEINNKHINTLGKAAEAQNAIRIKIEKRLNEMNTNKRKDEFVVHELKKEMEHISNQKKVAHNDIHLLKKRF